MKLLSRILKDLVRVIGWAGALLVLLTAITAIAWAFGAVWFDAPFGNENKVTAGLLAMASVAVLVFVRPFWRKLGVVALLVSGVLMWWLTLSPTNDSDWQPDVAQNPDEPIAWGVSSYEKLYNWIWFYNGYHAEHHFRPKVHWTRMQALHEQIVDRQRAAGVRVIKPPHALGFLNSDLPRHKQSGARPIKSEAVS